jgi:autotransporter-associated beta strand protein
MTHLARILSASVSSLSTFPAAKVGFGRLAILCGFFLVPCSRAANATWQGTNSAAWTDDLNWSAKPHPSGAQTATFSTAGGGRTTIDLAGLASISNVTFSGTAAAAYTLGAGGPNTQSLPLADNGILQLVTNVASPQRVDADIRLGAAAASSHSIRNDSPVHALTLAGDILPGADAAKTLTFLGNGSTTVAGGILSNGVSTLTVTNAGPGTLALSGRGAFTALISQGGATTVGSSKIRTLTLNNDTPYHVTGSNEVGTLYIYGTGASVITIAEGGYLAFGEAGGGTAFRAEQSATVNGPGKLVVAVGSGTNLTGDNYCAPGKTLTINADITGFQGLEFWSGAGTYVLNGRNDFRGNLSVGPATLVCSKIGNKNATDSNLGAGTTVTLTATGGLVYTGAGETTDRTFSLGATDNFLDMSGTGHLTFSTAIASAASRTLILRGSTEGTAELAAAFGGTVSAAIKKEGTGAWILSADNKYTGTTAVYGGTLILRGSATGKITTASGYNLYPGGTLLLDNTADANSTDRLGVRPVILHGGTLHFSNDGGTTNFSEVTGELRVNAAASVVLASRAAAGRTSTLTFSNIVRTGGQDATVDFQGEGLGLDTRNRILITAQPAGPLPPWVTCNGQPAAYSASLGVHTDPTGVSLSADIPAKGPYTLPDDPALAARITAEGSSGPLGLPAATSRLFSLTQASAWDAAVSFADGKTLLADEIAIAPAAAALTLGTAYGEGTLGSAYANRTLTLRNDSAAPLTVNAAISNTAALSMPGTGAVVFPVPAGASAALAIPVSGSGSLVKTGPGELTLAAANTFAGGVTLAEGTLATSTSTALGTGPVHNDGALDIAYAASDSTPSGLSAAMTGTGTVHVAAGTGTYITRFPGDFSSFTGDWFIGTNGGGRVLFNGPDNPGMTVNVASNTEFIAYPASAGSAFDNVRRARLVLGGGSAPDAYGNLRIDAGVEQAGPVTVLGPATTAGRGTFHTGSGEAAISGVIDDLGLGVPLSKSGSGGINLSEANTFTGPFHILAGSIRAPRLGTVAGGPSSLGNQPDAETAALRIGYTTTHGVLNYTGPGETTDRAILLTGTTAGANFYASTTGTVTFAGPLTAVTSGNKTLSLYGAPSGTPVPFQGTGVISGAISDYDADTKISISKASDTSVWILSGDNAFKGNVTVNNGFLVARHPNALGTDATLARTFQITQGDGATPSLVLDIPEGVTFPTNVTLKTSNVWGGAIINESGDNTFLGRVIMTGGSGDSAFTVNAGRLTLAGPVAPDTTSRRLRLWGNGDGEVSGAISNGTTTALPVWKERGSGTWLLSGPGAHTGLSSADSGTLVIGGAQGRVGGPVGANLAGTLAISNAPDANLADRIPDTAAASLSNGGSLAFTHPGGAADYAETLGALTVSATNALPNRVLTSRADAGRTSALTFASLSRSGGSFLDFSGDGLGLDDRNRIFITAQPEGPIGTWATLGGSAHAAYSPSLGVYADTTGSLFSDIPAKGPFAVPDAPAAVTRIASQGSDGPLTLLASPSPASLHRLWQDSEWASTLSLAGKTLRADEIAIAPGKAPLTIGAAPGDGLLAPLASGGALTFANDSVSPLTVNAAIMSDAPVAIQSGTVTLALPASATNTLAPNLAGTGTLAKDGPGCLTLTNNAAFAGGITVRGGTLYPTHNSAFGTTAGKTVVEPGGAIDIGFNATAQNLNFAREVFVVSGDGPDGSGAIVQTRNVSQYNAIHDIVLASNATFGVYGGTAARFDVRTAGTFDMGGHTLAKKGPGVVSISSVSVASPGHIDVKEGPVRTESSTKLNGDASNTLTVRSGATYQIYALATPVDWSLILEDNATFTANSGNNTSLNIWNGPVTLQQGLAVFSNASSLSSTVGGDISGPGTLWKTGAGTLYLTGKNNTYAGGTVLSNGIIHAYNPGALPDYAAPGALTLSSLTATNTLRLYTGDGTDGWSAGQISALLAAAPFNNANSTLAIDTSAADIDHALPLSGAMAFAKYGSGTLLQRAPLNITGALNVYNSGVLDFGPGVSATVKGNSYVNDTSAMYLTNNNTYAANAFVVEESGRLYLGPGSTLTTASGQDFHLRGTQNAKAFIDGTLTAVRDIVISRAASGDRATLVVNGGTVSAAHLYVGHNGTGRAGAVIQNGGVMNIGTNTSGADAFTLGSQGSYGYFQLNGGETRTGQFCLDGNSASGDPRNTVGIADLNAGTLTLTKSGGWLMHSWNGGGYGAFNIRNATLKAPAGANDTTLNYVANCSSYGIINLLGPDGLLDATGGANDRGVDLARSAGNQAGILNLNAGTLLANTVRAGSAATPTFLNFNGGTLRARPATSAAKAATFLQGLTRATVYPGGAVIDSDTANITVAQSLTAPDGHGVASVSLLSGGAGYLGAPFVVISGGSGTGATAIAQVDLDLGQVTALTVTSPGSGYQPGDVLTVGLRGGGFTSPAIAALPLLAPNAPAGGLTKLGAGTLTLAGANTYGGATAIAAGTLKLASAAALPADSPVGIASGATLDLNGLTVTNTVSGGGTVANGTLVTVISPAGENALGAEALTLSSAELRGTYLCDVTAAGASDHLTLNGNVDLSSLTLQLVNPANLVKSKVYLIGQLNGTATGQITVANADSRWHVGIHPDGTIRLIFVDGTLLFFK